MAGTMGSTLGEIVLRRMPGMASRAHLTVGPLTLTAAIGRSGITAFKHEGDGATPLASMELIEGFYRADRRPRPATRLPMRPLRADDGWCDAPFHARYNRPVQLPFSASHEAMWRKDGLYDIVLVMDWNVRSRKMGAGSAIFLHLIRPGYQPTEGCIALAPRDMERLLRAVTNGTRVTVRTD
jgi:L,D-peptidoglycan transpeptidase YkuD (ErfK/YbiS/YcfS/YnhG family)